MALDASVLQIRVESSGISDATRALNDLAKAGENAEQRTSNIGNGAKAASKIQIDAAQEAGSKYNSIIDMMEQKAVTFYQNAANAAAVAAQKEVFASASLADKLSAINQQSIADHAAKRAKETADTIADQQKILDGAKRQYAAQQELANRMNAAYDNKAAARASKDSDDFVASLKRQAEMVGLTSKELKEYTAQAQLARAAQLGVTNQVAGFVETLKNAKGPHESFNLLTAGSTREMLVLAHELSQGSLQRFGGSLIVLAERINFLPQLLEKAAVGAEALGMSLGGLIVTTLAVVAVIAAATITWYKSTQALKEMRAEVILTGNAMGVTGDQLYDMANKIGEATGHYGDANEAVAKLAGTGRFTASQIGLIADAAVNMQKYGGPAIEDTIKQFEKLAGDPMKATARGYTGITEAAVELNKQLHFLDPQVLAEAQQLQRIGEYAKASDLLITNLATTEKTRTEQLHNNLSPLGKLFDDVAERAKKAWYEIFHAASDQDNLKTLQDHLKTLRINGFGDDSSFVQSDMQKIQALTQKIAADNKKAQDDARDRAKKDAAVDAENSLNNLLKKAKGETEFSEARIRAEKAFQTLRDQGIKTDLLDADNQKIILDYLQKQTTVRQAKPKSEGLSGLDKEIAQINELYEVQKRADDNQIKLIDFMQQHQLMSDSTAQTEKSKILDKEMQDQKTVLEKELAAIDAFHTSDTRLANDAATKKANILKQLGIIRENIDLKQKENALVPDAQEAAFQKAADDETKRFLDSTGKQAQAIQEKIDAYNRLPEAIRNAGVTEKQMQDQFTQSAIDFKNEQISSITVFDDAGKKQVERYKAQRDALIDLAAKQKAWEDIQKNNQAALNTPAALKAAAAEQVKLWKDTGNEIEKALTNAFGNIGSAAGKMFKAFAEGQANQIDNVEKIREAQMRQSKEGIDQTEVINQLQTKGQLDQLNMYGNLAQSAANFFDKGSTGYEVLHKVSQAYYLAETVAALATIPAKLAAGAATMFAQGGFAGFAGTAAMVAAVAAFGVAVSGGGGSGQLSSADQQKVQGTGTVLGSPTDVEGNKVVLVGAKSDSIANSLKIVEKNSGLGLVVQTSMLDALNKLNSTIADSAKAIATQTNVTGSNVNLNTNNGLGTTVVKAGVSMLGSAIGSFFGPIGTLLGGVVGSLAAKIPVLGNLLGKVGTAIFGGKQTLDDSGLSIGSTNLANVASGNLNAQTYANITTSGGWFSSDKHNTQLGSVGKDVNDQISAVIIGMSDTLKVAAKSLGIDGQAFTDKLNGFVIDIGNVSFKGMTGDQIQQTLQNIFSKLGDQMAQYAFSDLQQYQKIGEGMLETVTRVANDLLQVNDVFAVLGKTIPANVNAIAVSEQLVTQFGSTDDLTKGVKAYISAIYTEEQKLVPVTKSVNDAMAKLGLSTVYTKDQFKSLVDGLDLTTTAGQEMFATLVNIAPQFGEVADALAKGFNDYTDAIYSDQEKLAATTKTVSDTLSSLGVTGVTTKEQFKTLVEGIDLTTVAGRTLYQALLGIAPQFATVANAADDAAKTAADAAKQAADDAASAAKTHQQNLLTDVDAAFSTLSTVVNKQKDAITAGAKTATDALQKQLDAANTTKSSLDSVYSSISSALNNVTSASTKNTLALRQEAQAYIVSATANISAGGDPTKFTGLQGALDTVGKSDTSLYKNAEDYQRDQALTKNSLEKLQGAAKQQVDTGQLTIDRLNDTIAAINDQRDAQLAALDKVVSDAQEQINVLKGQSTTLLSIDTTMKALADAINAARANPTISANSAISTAYQNALGRTPDTEGLAYWNQQAANGNSVSDIVKSISSSSEAKNNIVGLYSSLLNRAPDQAGLDYWMNALANGNSLSAITAAFKDSDEYKSIPHFAKGTNNLPSDMLAMVHKGERIVPAADNAELMRRMNSDKSADSDTKQMLSELKDATMRGDVATVQMLTKMFKIFQKWDLDGQPEVRDVDEINS